MFTPVAVPNEQPKRKHGLKPSKKIENLKTIFKALPKVHKTRVVFEALAKAANLRQTTIDRHLELAMQLLEGGA